MAQHSITNDIHMGPRAHARPRTASVQLWAQEGSLLDRSVPHILGGALLVRGSCKRTHEKVLLPCPFSLEEAGTGLGRLTCQICDLTHSKYSVTPEAIKRMASPTIIPRRYPGLIHQLTRYTRSESNYNKYTEVELGAVPDPVRRIVCYLARSCLLQPHRRQGNKLTGDRPPVCVAPG
ncbi:hypothetical protein J6590_018769 [Homalodisca vitripennis]|nr:hypothetical protein J6590_018769 [Homalodisca vitripennis]